MTAILVTRRPDGLFDLAYQMSTAGNYTEEGLTLAEAQDHAQRNWEHAMEPKGALVRSPRQEAITCGPCRGRGRICKPFKGGVSCYDCPPCRNSGFVVLGAK